MKQLQDRKSMRARRLSALAAPFLAAPFLAWCAVPGYAQDFAPPRASTQALTRTALHPITAAQADADPVAPQATPTTPTPPAPGSTKDELFAGTEKFSKGASDVTEVNMTPDSLNMVGGDNAAKAHRTLLSVVRTYTYDKPGMYNQADVEEYRHKLEGGDWHCSVHTRDSHSGESTDVCSRHPGTGLVENAIITTSPKSLTFIHNIRRLNGQGGHVEGGAGSDLSLLPFSGLGFLSAPVDGDSDMVAQRLASQALMHAQQAQLQAAMGDLTLTFPDLGNLKLDGFKDLQGLGGTLKSFDFKMSPEQTRELKQLQKQLDSLGQGHR